MVANYATNLSDALGRRVQHRRRGLLDVEQRSFAGDDLDYRYLTDGTPTGDTIDDSGWVADFAADGAYNPRTEKLWRVNVGGDDCIYELDPAARVATGNKICPAFGRRSAVSRTTSCTDTFYSGLVDGRRHSALRRARGRMLDSAYVAVPVSGLAFNSTRTAGCTP